jgi:hypothetical protein
MTLRSQSDDVMDISDPQCVMGQLNIIERCLAARKPGTWTETHESDLQTLADYCDRPCEVYGTDGNPIGGNAYRLAQDLGWELNSREATRGPTPAITRSVCGWPGDATTDGTTGGEWPGVGGQRRGGCPPAGAASGAKCANPRAGVVGAVWPLAGQAGGGARRAAGSYREHAAS